MMIVGAGLLCACAKEEPAYVDIFYTADAEGFYNSRPEPRFENAWAGGYAILKSFFDHVRRAGGCTGWYHNIVRRNEG